MRGLAHKSSQVTARSLSIDVAQNLRAFPKLAPAVAALKPDDPEHLVVFHRAHSCVAVGEVETAEQLFREAIKIKPDFAEAHNNLGALLDGTEAINAYREAIKFKRDFGLAYANLGGALKQSGQVEEAVAVLREGIKFNPRSAYVYNALGVVLSEQDDLSRAEGLAALRRSVKLDPYLTEAHYNLGVALYQNGEPRKAIGRMRKAIAVDSNFANAHFFLGKLHYESGQLTPAIASFREALRIAPEHAPFYCGLGMALGANGKIAESIVNFGYAINFATDDEYEAELVEDALNTFIDYLEAKTGNDAAVVESKEPGYNGDDMDIAAEFPAVARTLSNRELNEYIEKGTLAAVELRQRETTTSRATAASRVDAAATETTAAQASAPQSPRLKWHTDRRLDENPATFAWRAYQAEAKAGTLHQGLIYDEDRELYRRFRSWLRSNAMPEEIEIPTKRDWNTREVVNLATLRAALRRDPKMQEVRRLEAVARRRRSTLG